MEEFKKHQIKMWLKSKKKWIIGTGAFLLAGLIAFFVGMAASGVDLGQMMTSPFAVTIYILILLFLLIAGLAIYAIFMKKEGDK